MSSLAKNVFILDFIVCCLICRKYKMWVILKSLDLYSVTLQTTKAAFLGRGGVS